ncbi:diguanylate cyclase [Roseibium marinum]|uniref:PAS domain S-box-containing protein/diguanylate cyclase (GGDEF)-like protein n=1 Tax=Roseibium marinum TaxID=281252 RepID=A0A2S3UTU8_9HYPH|nr:diguanylate cyclase [Roseibium marinum]POF30990.1 PAS domain S-box-containing protein/diguanylate cyclase (GGDEF)-like protein [Roseibium marinum]
MAESITLDLEQSFGALNECVLVTNPDRIIVYANEAVARLLRVERGDLVGTRTKRFFADPAEFEEIGELYRSPEDPQARKKAYAFEVIRSDGTTTSVEVVNAPIFNSTDILSGFLFVVRDISERKALEKKLSDVALTLEDALEAISEGFAIFDSDDRLIICNDNYRDIYTHSTAAIVPGSRFEDILRFGLNSSQYNTGGLSDDEWIGQRLEKHRKADGSVIEQNLADGRWLRISETRTRSGGTAGIRADITELKEARARAESAYKNLSLMADNVSASITEIDLEGLCVFINKTGCEWFDGSPEELIGTSLRDRLPWKEREVLRPIFRQALLGQKVASEVSLNFPDGVRRECHLDCNPRVNDQGDVEGLVVLVNDITDRKKTEQTLAELYAITSTRELCHEEKIAEILSLGCEHFELPFGIISDIDEDRYTLTHTHAPEGELVPGTTFPLGDTYCALTLQANGPIATANAAQSEFAQHPCYELFALETYIGAPLLIDGVPHGTINFSAPEPRKRDFTAAEIQIVRQFADWIGHEIARQRDHQALMDAKINLERVASIDDLTQVLNRRAFLERANTEIQRFRRSKQPFTAVMLDIDNFKQINDQFGHAAGDEVLARFSRSISNALRAVDVFGRVGGEEFCLILHETQENEALLVCERLRRKILTDLQMEQIEQTITCSMGLAVAAREDIEFSTLMQKADTALYQAKASGRNKCVIFGSEPAPTTD